MKESVQIEILDNMMEEQRPATTCISPGAEHCTDEDAILSKVEEIPCSTTMRRPHHHQQGGGKAKTGSPPSLEESAESTSLVASLEDQGVNDDEEVFLMEIVAERSQQRSPAVAKEKDASRDVLKNAAADSKEAVILSMENNEKASTKISTHLVNYFQDASISGRDDNGDPPSLQIGLPMVEPIRVPNTCMQRMQTPGAYAVAPRATSGSSEEGSPAALPAGEVTTTNSTSNSPRHSSSENPGEESSDNRDEQGASTIREENQSNGTCPPTSQQQQLTVANPINGEDESIHNNHKESLQQAQEYHVITQANRQSQQRQNHFMRALGIVAMGLLFLLILVLLSVFLLKRSGETQQQEGEQQSAATTNTSAPTPTPATAWEEHLLEVLPPNSLKTIRQDANSPQAMAYEWLLADVRQHHLNTTTNYHNNYNNYTDGRILQRFALATFYYATLGDEWTNNDGWMDHQSHECTWYSSFDTSCYGAEDEQELEGEVFEDLYLDENNLQGTIPTELFLLSRLRVVGLPHNALGGTIPSQVASLGDVLALVLFENELSGMIPTTLPQNLMLVGLSSNQLSGPIPTEVGLLSMMFEFNVADNTLQGPIPSELGQLESLQRLWLSDNDLTGTIPDELALLVTNNSGTLEGLAIHGNYLSGTVPDTLCSLGDIIFDCADHLCGCNCSCGTSDNDPSATMLMQVAPGESIEWAP